MAFTLNNTYTGTEASVGGVANDVYVGQDQAAGVGYTISGTVTGAGSLVSVAQTFNGFTGAAQNLYL